MPRGQAYCSDVRFALGAADCRDGERVCPPSSVVRFAAGDLLDRPFGGCNVVVMGDVEGAAPRVRVFDTYLHGVLPSSLLENFVLWQDTDMGVITGEKRQRTRRTEAGAEVPFVDPFFDYGLEIRPTAGGGGGGGQSVAVRVDTDVVTGEQTRRTLLNVSRIRARIKI